MRLLEVINKLERGGAERFVVDLCNEFSRRGHEVVLMVIGRGFGESPYLSSLSADVERIPLDCDTSGTVKAIRTMFRVHRALTAVQADAVHCHLSGLQLCLLSMLLNFRKIPFFYTVHNDAFFDAGTYLRLNRFIFQKLRVHPVAISPTSTESFRAAYGFDPMLIVNGCAPSLPADSAVCAAKKELASQRKFSDGIVFINQARVVGQKNQLALAEAAKLCVDRNVRLDIFIMGEICDAETAEKLRQLELPFVHFIGPRDDPLSYLAAADALVLPSLKEGMPLSLLEACAVSRPACVTQVGGMRDFVADGVNGVVAERPDPESIAEMLTRFCAIPAAARKKMGERAHRTYQEHTMARCADSYLRYMEKHLSRRRHDGQ